MSGPITRRILQLTGASSDEANDDEGKRDPGNQPNGASSDIADSIAKGTPIHLLAFRKFIAHCGTCGLIFLVSVAWMLGLIPSFDSPFARAAEVEKIRDVVAEMYARQLSADIRAYEEALCRGSNPFLEGELERAQIEYEKQTGRRYPEMPCPSQHDSINH